MSEQCFLVEPVYGFDGMPSAGRPINRWDGTNRVILGWCAVDNPEEIQGEPHLFGPGAMYAAVWLAKGWTWDNETEPHLYLQTEDGGWDIDGRAVNCTLPYDRTHRCWVRTGVAPLVMVGKSGHTCQAGLFSPPNYHGLLQHGRMAT